MDAIPEDNNQGSQLEIEVKFCLEDAETWRQRVLQLGAQSVGKSFEYNIRYDDAHGSLMHAKALLRLRRDARTVLTYKSAADTADPDFKIQREIEVEVSDFAAMAHILEALGYGRRQIYEKWRETFSLQPVMICLDAMPFGLFMEIEGPKAAIMDVVQRLGLDWDLRITANYLEIFELLRTSFQLPFEDISFENFKSWDIDAKPLLTQLQHKDGAKPA